MMAKVARVGAIKINADVNIVSPKSGIKLLLRLLLRDYNSN
jgi:hypothetical protein